MPAGKAMRPVELRVREATDSLPGKRADLPPGTLRGMPPEPQGDENRDPPANAPTPPVREQSSVERDDATRLTPAQQGTQPMNAMTDKTRDVYLVGLRNQHAVENQAIELLERQVGRLENYPEMSERMRKHIAESKEQARRIEELLSGLGSSHSTFKDTAMSVLGNLMALGHTPAADEVLKNTLANFAFEHYEIAAYKSLLTLAEAAGHNAAKAALQASLREEEAMAEWIDQHIAPTTLRYVERSAAGQKAGV
jgi:ferritin-like metal-binding protein YciE